MTGRAGQLIMSTYLYQPQKTPTFEILDGTLLVVLNDTSYYSYRAEQ